MDPLTRLNNAIHSDNPSVNLDDLSKRLRDEGMPQKDLYNLYSSVFTTIENDHLNDILANVMGNIWSGALHYLIE